MVFVPGAWIAGMLLTLWDVAWKSVGEGWSEPCYCPSSVHCCARPPESRGKWEGWMGEDEGRLATRQTRHFTSATLTSCELVDWQPRCYVQLGCVDISVRYLSLLVDLPGPSLPVNFFWSSRFLCTGRQQQWIIVNWCSPMPR